MYGYGEKARQGKPVIKSFKAKCFRCLQYKIRKELHKTRATGKYECKNQVNCLAITLEASQ